MEISNNLCIHQISQTNSNAIIEECKHSFDVKPLSDLVAARKLAFLQRYSGTTNTICSDVNEVI